MLGWLTALSGCGDRPSSEVVAPREVALIPAPAAVMHDTGSFVLSGKTQLLFTEGSPGEPVARYFIELLERTRGLKLPANGGGAAGGAQVISFEVSAGEAVPDEEGYSLAISPERIVLASRSARGLFYGATTLWQLLEPPQSAAAALSVPAMRIVDAPRFRWRGLLLDSARHYQSPQFIKDFIDVMALHKLNVLQWHLTDDQGWRIEIKQYPRLTSVGAWRVPAGPVAAADIDPATGKPRLYGGFYSQDEVREIVAYAAQRHVTIVPEIGMPGHASAAIAAYPELGVSGATLPGVPADWGVYTDLFNVEDATFTFLENVLGEVIALFPGEYVHVGGDEAVKDQWRASRRVQARMRQLGIKDEHGLQSYFIQRIEKYLNKHGRRAIGWDEILEGGIAPNATVMSWRGVTGAVTAASAGHDAVLAPAPTLYLDHRPLGQAIPGRDPIIGIRDIYLFDPMPAALDEAQRHHILGVQANLWTEHMRSEQRVAYMAFPRAAALAEIAWSPAAQIEWASFSQRLPAQLARYRALGMRHAEESAEPQARGTRRTSHELTSCNSNLILSLEDDAPLQGARAVFLVDIMQPCWLYKGVELSRATGLGAAVGQLPFNFQIGEDRKKIRLRKPQSAAGELEVRIDSCEGERIAVLPLAPAAGNYAVTELPPVAITAREGNHDLCFTFTQASLEPMWVIDAVEVLTGDTAQDGLETSDKQPQRIGAAARANASPAKPAANLQL